MFYRSNVASTLGGTTVTTTLTLRNLIPSDARVSLTILGSEVNKTLSVKGKFAYCYAKSSLYFC